MQRHRFNVHDEFKKESNTSATNISHGGNNNLDFEAGSTDFLRDRYWLTRVVLLRGLGFVYMVAFLVALNDNAALLGENGLLPATRFMDRVQHHLADLSPVEKLLKLPTIFWFVLPTANNLWWAAGTGVAFSGFVAVTGAANFPIMALLWALYHSIINVGQTWYSFGWESQLLETGFLAMFLVPWLSLARFPKGSPTPLVCVWGYRWLMFRIMFGAGLIKMRGDPCWKDLTCMDYHYQTQPNPNPLSRYLHLVPGSPWHKVEVMGNHLVELVLPWGLLLGRRLRIVSGWAQILFQTVIIVSGNLSFLNWLTIVPAIFSFDDLHLAGLFSRADRRAACSRITTTVAVEEHSKEEKKTNVGVAIEAEVSNGVTVACEDDVIGGPQLGSVARADGSCQGSHDGLPTSARRWLRATANVLLVVLVVKGSLPVVKNMAGVGVGQVMNTSFDSFRIVNTYGNFGSITKQRGEVVLTGTEHHDPFDPTAEWHEYGFKCKPGDLNQRPCLITPFHYRLDWQMWFAAFQNYGANPWMVNLVSKLLSPDDCTRAVVGSLLRHDPFAADPAGGRGEESVGDDGACKSGTDEGDRGDAGSGSCVPGYGGGPPLFIKADLYLYEFTPLMSATEDATATTPEVGPDLGAVGGPGRQNSPRRPSQPLSLSPSSSGSQNEKERGVYWTRTYLREYMPPVSLENPSLHQFLRSHGLE